MIARSGHENAAADVAAALSTGLDRVFGKLVTPDAIAESIEHLTHDE